jgi:pyruvate dehydrogenase E2 component (dihydrolipoamide acetyltransferase)
MPVEILMPRLGWTMEEGIFGEWLLPDGTAVHPGDLLFTVEGDKATQEVEAFDHGTLYIPPDAPQPGDTVVVGARVAYLLRADERKPAVTAASMPTPVDAHRATPLPTSQPQTPTTHPAASPRARRVAAELGVDWTTLRGSGRSGRIVERDIRAAATPPPAPTRITPVAQRPGTRIDRADVEAALAASSPAAPDERLPITPVRRTIAARMLASAQVTAPVTLTTEADATELVALRAQLHAAYTPHRWTVPTYNDLFIKLTAAALQAHPLLNATWTDDAILLHRAIHMGLAVDLTDGLRVPVLRDVHTKSLRQISAERHDLVELARTGRLESRAMQGGTFTITNLGMVGIDAFTPLINPPECAILGIGRIQAKPAVYQGAIAPRDLVTLSLSFDHRIVDGAPAARFLQTVAAYIATPLLWLTT